MLGALGEIACVVVHTYFMTIGISSVYGKTRDAGGARWHDALARRLPCEQVQTTGYIEYNRDLNAGVQINSSLLSVVLHD